MKRDPDYLNAWKLFLSIGQNISLPNADRDAAVVALMRLDPLSKHVPTDRNDISSLKALWEAAERLQSLKPPPTPEILYPLTASQAVIEKHGGGEMARFRGGRFFQFGYRGYPGYREPGTIPTPGEMVAAQKIVSTVIMLMEMDTQTRRGNG